MIKEKQRLSKSAWLQRFMMPLAAVSLIVATGGLVAGIASAGPAEDCQAVRDRDHAIYLQLIAALPPGAPIPPEIINPCIEAPSTTPTTMAPPTFDTPTNNQTSSGGPGYGADIPHTGTLTITTPPPPGAPAAPVAVSGAVPVNETTTESPQGTIEPGVDLLTRSTPNMFPGKSWWSDGCLTWHNPDGSCAGSNSGRDISSAAVGGAIAGAVGGCIAGALFTAGPGCVPAAEIGAVSGAGTGATAAAWDAWFGW